jgi:hypothetical protein
MVILPTWFIDKRIISYLRTGERLNEARNNFSRIIGLKSFREMSKLNYVLVDVDRVSKIYTGMERFYFKSIIYNSCEWVAPEDGCNVSLCYDGNLNLFFSVLFDGYEKMVGQILFNLEGNCIRATEVEGLARIVNHGNLSAEISSDFNIYRFICSKNLIKKSSPIDFWKKSGLEDIRDDFSKSKTISHLYSAICEFVGEDGFEYFQKNGLAIYDVIQDILNGNKNFI